MYKMLQSFPLDEASVVAFALIRTERVHRKRCSSQLMFRQTLLIDSGRSSER